MSICININEDIIMTLDRYARNIKGENPGPFLTSFSRNNNPYSNSKKIKENKTFVYGENKQLEKNDNNNKINKIINYNHTNVSKNKTIYVHYKRKNINKKNGDISS